MPALRRLDGAGADRVAIRGIQLAVAGGAAAAAAAIAVLRGFGLENLHGPLPARIASTAFAAITLELVVHLAVMSGVVRLTRSRLAGVIVSALLFAVIHAAGALQAPLPIAVSVVVVNAALGMFLGWLYLRFGFECVMLAHAVAHLVAVTVT
jgi:membrane protease YdiL (CAAX protease family)